jgi:hypothetical protein
MIFRGIYTDILCLIEHDYLIIFGYLSVNEMPLFDDSDSFTDVRDGCDCLAASFYVFLFLLLFFFFRVCSVHIRIAFRYDLRIYDGS